MPSLINALMGKDKGMNDQVIANGMLAADKAAAGAYLMAALESATPELRRIYQEYLTTLLVSHEAITQLCVNRNWLTPYASPVQQLETTYDQSQQVMNMTN